jgi:hypothetical protein
MMSTSDLETEVNFQSATKFIEDAANLCNLIENNKFYPQVLVAF